MEKDFWLERWEKKETGFHQEDFNPHLQKFWKELRIPQGCEVFVPLCGKSLDLLWLRNAHHRVLGVEISSLAVRSFFEENGMRPAHGHIGKFEFCEAEGIGILCGDFFDLEEEDLARVGAVYDRASLIALPPEMRERYAEHLAKILPVGTRILLIALEYDQSEMSGPPFSVSEEEVEALFGGFSEVKKIASIDALEANPRFRMRGATRLLENVFLLEVN